MTEPTRMDAEHGRAERRSVQLLSRSPGNAGSDALHHVGTRLASNSEVDVVIAIVKGHLDAEGICAAVARVMRREPRRLDQIDGLSLGVFGRRATLCEAAVRGVLAEFADLAEPAVGVAVGLPEQNTPRAVFLGPDWNRLAWSSRQNRAPPGRPLADVPLRRAEENTRG